MSRDRERPIIDWPGYWFLLLERNLTNGDILAAAECQRQLKRLGVAVLFHCEAKAEGSANHADR